MAQMQMAIGVIFDHTVELGVQASKTLELKLGYVNIQNV